MPSHWRPSQIVGTYCDFQSYRPQDPGVSADTPVDSGYAHRPEKPSNHLWAVLQRDRLMPFDFSRAPWLLFPTGHAPWCDGADGRGGSFSSAARLRERNAGTRVPHGAAAAPG